MIIYSLSLVPLIIFVEVEAGTLGVNWFLWLITLYLTNFAGGGVGDIVSIFSDNIDQALSNANLPIVPSLLVSGYYIGY